MSEPGRTPSVSRRSFLGGAGVAAGGVALLGDPHPAAASDEPIIAGPRAMPPPRNADKLPILAALVRRAVPQAAGTSNQETPP